MHNNTSPVYRQIKVLLTFLMVFTIISARSQPRTTVETKADGSTITTTIERFHGDEKITREYRNAQGRRTRMEGKIRYYGMRTDELDGIDSVEIDFDENGDTAYSRRLIYDGDTILVQRRTKRFNEGRRVFDEHEWLNADGTRYRLRTYDPRTGTYETYPKEEYAAAQGSWTTTATGHRGKIGQRFIYQFPPGDPLGVWGTDVYTDDSSIAGAAVHAGLITRAAGGTVTIEIRAGQSSYRGSSRNGVTSNDYGNWGGSFVFVR